MDIAHPFPGTAVPPPADWIIQYSADGDAVRAFCEKYGVLAEAETAVRLAKECFNSTAVRLQVEWDPEDGEGEWLVIEIAVKGTVNEVLAMNDRYKTALIAAVPLEKLLYLRLLYYFT